nr:MAG TPA: Protein of unknown function (DUF1566) [Caudoviricetes sp.]
MGIQTKKISAWLSANGQAVTNASKNSMIEAINANSLQMYDGVFIMFHRKSDGFPLAVPVSDWPSRQSAGQIADGVLLVEGGKHVVVAPTEASNGLPWSSKPTKIKDSKGNDVSKGDGVQISGVVTTGDRLTAFVDFTGKANTAAILKASTTTNITNTADYAPGFCNKYARANANNKGLLAGSWWLPSLAELALIWANFDKVNYALSKIAGATQLQKTWYWSSTQTSADTAWGLYLSDGIMGTYYKFYQLRVRPVSAFLW